MKHLSFCILLFFIGCTSKKEDIPEHIRGIENLIVYSEDVEPDSSIDMIRETAFKAPNNFSLDWYDDSVTLYSWFAGIEIDGSGRVFIADNSALKIHVFDSGGSYITSLGGEGRGPGEYSGFTDTEMVSNKLHIFDFLQFRTTIYSLDSLKVIEAADVRPPVNKDEFDEITDWLRTPALLRSDGTYLAGFMEHWPNAIVGSPAYNLKQDRPIKYYFMNRESKLISNEVLELKKQHADLVAQVGDRHLNNIRALPFLGRSIITISDDNHIYTTWTDDFLIKAYGPDGNYLRAFYHPFQKKSLNREEILSLMDEDDRNHELVQHAELPETWPAINSIIPDDKNRLWVSKIIADDGVHEWWVLQDTGELVTKFTWPDNRSIEAVKNGFVYSLETDKETGQQKFVKYRIEMS